MARTFASTTTLWHAGICVKQPQRQEAVRLRACDLLPFYLFNSIESHGRSSTKSAPSYRVERHHTDFPIAGNANAGKELDHNLERLAPKHTASAFVFNGLG